MAVINLASALKFSLYKWCFGTSDYKGNAYVLGYTPHNSPVEIFKPYKAIHGNSSSPGTNLGFQSSVSITSGTSVFNSWGVRERNAYKPSDTWYYRNDYYTFPVEQFQDRNVSTIFLQKTEPTNLLSYSVDLLGDSSTEFSVSLLNGWTFNKTDTWSGRTMSYLLKVIDGGVNGEASFIFRRIPYIQGNSYYANSSWGSFYSEALYGLLNRSTNKAHWLGGQPTNEYTALWAETRRKDPTVKDLYVTLMLPEDRKLHYFEWIQPVEYERIEYDLPIPCKQVTWFNGEIILLSLDMKLYRYLPASGMTEIYDTSFNSWDDVMLVTHPDQTYCYLIGGTSQVILDSDLVASVVTETWSGLEKGLGYTTFDVNGKIWVGNVRRSEVDLSVEYTHDVPALCNYTYLASSNGNCYSLEGELYENTPATFASDVYVANLRWRYPQTVLVPYNHNDFVAMTEQNIWWGYDSATEEFVEYNGTNAIPIPDTDPVSGLASVVIKDGVQINFKDEGGARTLVADEYIYFTVAQGFIRDALSNVTVKLLLERYNYIQKYIDVLIAGTTLDIPERGATGFRHMNTTIIQGYWDNDVDMRASFTTSDTTPNSGQVYINSNGSLIFNALDVGRVFYMDYFVAYEV